MTTQPILPPCNPTIWREGTCVYVPDWYVPSNAMERWVKRVAEVSEQPVDWHYFGGIPRVLALGDLERVKTVIEELSPELERLRQITYDVQLRRQG